MLLLLGNSIGFERLSSLGPLDGCVGLAGLFGLFGLFRAGRVPVGGGVGDVVAVEWTHLDINLDFGRIYLITMND